jgi:hypothetical protein
VLGVDVQDVTHDARQFIGEYGLILDRRGRITAVRRGPVDERFTRERVVPLLMENA